MAFTRAQIYLIRSFKNNECMFIVKLTDPFLIESFHNSMQNEETVKDN